MGVSVGEALDTGADDEGGDVGGWGGARHDEGMEGRC